MAAGPRPPAAGGGPVLAVACRVTGVKAVLSDLGGVLIEYSFHLATAEWARLAGVDPARLAERLVVDEAWEAFEVGALTERAFCDHLRHSCGLDLDDADLISGWNAIYLGVNVEVERLLREVAHQGVRLVAVTNTNVTHQRVWQERFADALEPFGAVYSSCEAGARKPEPAFLEHVLDSERLAPQETVFVDDMLVNVEAARRLGIDAVLYAGADRLRKAFAGRGLLVY